MISRTRGHVIWHLISGRIVFFTQLHVISLSACTVCEMCGPCSSFVARGRYNILYIIWYDNIINTNLFSTSGWARSSKCLSVCMSVCVSGREFFTSGYFHSTRPVLVFPIVHVPSLFLWYCWAIITSPQIWSVNHYVTSNLIGYRVTTGKSMHLIRHKWLHSNYG